MSGILALWNDCKPGAEADYETWYQGEHLYERLGIPGVNRGRRYRAEGASPEFFTYYEVSSPDVLSSPAYIGRLNDPTPMTQKIMSGIFVNMSRTVCRVLRREGVYRGSHVATLRLDGTAAALSLFNDPAALPVHARVELWENAEGPAREPTAEEKLRGGGDDKIAACLMIECLRREEADAALSWARDRLGDHVQASGVYALLCELTSDALNG